jgi:fatty acid desaturase
MGWTGTIGRMGGTGWIGRMGGLLLAIVLTAPALAAQPPAGQSEFVPLKELPPSEQMPAAPLLITAYAVFLVLMVFYVWTVWRRLNKVDADLRALEQRMAKR